MSSSQRIKTTDQNQYGTINRPANRHSERALNRGVSAISTTSIATFVSIAPPDTGRPANLVLLACCALQLPVWGFVNSYGVLQDYYSGKKNMFTGDISATGVIGTTLNGIIYLAMPVFFGMFTHKYSQYRRLGALFGVFLSGFSLVASSFATAVWELVLMQGVLQALGSTILYSATTIYLDEWFVQKKGFAYGAVLGIKSGVGVVLPLLLELMLGRLGFGWSLRIWAIVTVTLALPSIWFLYPRHMLMVEEPPKRSLNWSFLRHQTFWVFQAANVIFSMGYGLPQTYIPQYASQALGLNSRDSALMLVALNVPSTAASFWFGALSDGRGLPFGKSMSIATASLVSAIGACLPTFLLWGLLPGPGPAGVAMLALYAMFYGFFAGGYSATWGGVVNEMRREAEERDEAVDTGLIFGLLNGGRGIGFVSGGLIGVELLKVGGVGHGNNAYASNYGAVIIFVGTASAIGTLCALSRQRKFV